MLPVMNPYIKSKSTAAHLSYRQKQGLLKFVDDLKQAAPMRIVATEQYGVSYRLVDDLAKAMGLPRAKLLKILGAPRPLKDPR